MTLALACSIGLHWSFLQSIAWTSMLVSNLSTSSFSQAVQRTFDGKHPCSLCKVIASGKKSEKRSERIQPLKKFDALGQPLAIPVVLHIAFPMVEGGDSVIRTLPYAPLTPPPRPA